ELKPMVPGLIAATPYVYTEAILAQKGQIGGVMIEGIDEATVHQVLNLKARLVEGSIDLKDFPDAVAPKALIGKGIASKFNLKIGDQFRIVVPLPAEFQSSNFKPKLGKFT